MIDTTWKERQEKAERLVAEVTNLDEVFTLIRELEHAFDLRVSMITRRDVEEEYSTMWDYEGVETKELSPEQWEKFKDEWLWRKGYNDVMWEGVTEAIRWDLREAGLTPEEAVI